MISRGSIIAWARRLRRFDAIPVIVIIILLTSSPPIAAADGPEDGGDGGHEPATPVESGGGPRVVLSSGRSFPLLGVGVGNMLHDIIPEVLSHAVRPTSEEGFGHRLVDTASSSWNEEIVADAIDAGLGGAGAGDDPVHVVTKVWYTHLGYDRTRLSVLESMEKLRNLHEINRNIKVHVLLHWPRCHYAIDWMDCEGEEERLPQYVKDIGPPPHLDTNLSWGASWRALEDLYDPSSEVSDSGDSGSDEEEKKNPYPNMTIESIGVSNFELGDLEGLMAGARIKPHIYQGNIWVALYDRGIMTTIRDNNVHFQAYNVMNGILGNAEQAPNAYRQLVRIGRDLYEHAVTSPGGSAVEARPPFSAATVLLAWLVQSEISVMPRAGSMENRLANSVDAVMAVPFIPDPIRFDVEQFALALLKGEDIIPPGEPDGVGVSFWNGLQSAMSVFWILPETGEEILQHAEPLLIGQEVKFNAHPGHRFAAYSHDRNVRKEFTVIKGYGEHQHFAVEVEL